MAIGRGLRRWVIVKVIVKGLALMRVVIVGFRLIFHWPNFGFIMAVLHFAR